MRLLDALLPKKPLPPVPDLLGEDYDPEEDPKRHRHYLEVFAFLLTNTTHRIDTLTDHLADERITTQEWAAHFRDELTAAHSEAWGIGRKLAGDAKAINRADFHGGVEAWARQEEFFAGFLKDLESGRYTNPDGSLNEKGFGARARSYGQSIRGTVNESFKASMGTDLLDWNLGDAVHCGPNPDFPYDCPSLSEMGPLPADEWPTQPVGFDCECLYNCKCYFTSADGRFSTQGI